MHMAGTSTSGNFGHAGRPGQVGGSVATRPNASKSEIAMGQRSRKQRVPICPTLEELMAERFSTRGKKKPTKKQLAALIAKMQSML